MDSENIHCCQLCHSEFEAEDDLSLHKCIEIKQEFQDSKVLDIYDVGQKGDLELSEEFLSSIIKQVEDLCDSIQEGDPIVERAISVNQQLIDAVSSYRNQLILIDSKHVEMGQDIWDDFDNLMESDKNDSDTEYKPKIKNNGKKNKLPNADSIAPTSKVDKVTKPKVSKDENPDFKGFRGLLPFLRYNNDKESDNESVQNKSDSDFDPDVGKKSSKKPKTETKTKCKLLKNPKTTKAKTSKSTKITHLSRDMIPYMKYINGNTVFECTICNETFEKKLDMFQHLKSTHDSEITQKIAATKKKSFSKEHIDKMMDIVKSQCGNHSINSMAEMVKLNTSTIRIRIRMEGIVFAKQDGECYFCVLKKSHLKSKDCVKSFQNDTTTFLYLKYDKEEKLFYCSICNRSGQGTSKGRATLLCHIKTIHQKTAKLDEIVLPKKQNICEDGTCKEIYGSKKHELWCKQCGEKKENDPKEKQFKLCPDCGKSVRGLKWHRETMHSAEKHKCPKCELKFSNIHYLKDHMKNVHEKVPCPQCGKLFGLGKGMSRHIDTQHTSYDEKKFRCDECGKTFITNDRLKNHKNIHTGEKPYKCKFCSACFASGETRYKHQRSHLGTNH